MSKAFKYIFIIVLIFSVTKLNAQDFEDDAALWLNVYLEKRIKDKFDVHFTHSSRINNNFSEYGLGYGDIGLTYYYKKNIKIMADYVLRQQRNLNGSYSTRNRAYLALLLKKEIGRFKFGYRNLFQGQLTDMYTSEKGLIPVFYDRNKVSVKYDINKRFTASVSEELYYPLYQAKNKGFDRSRSTIGLTYKFSKRTNIEFAFTYRHELNAFSRTKRDFIYGVTFSRIISNSWGESID